ncbi:uncharacterized protein LOC127248024 [Andrographis paniculata]|uniref:uncharacterized protein LOC127248024 n=1 Tax=Andrographis paniculata TaxID=175694 RepID=UPI0021E733BF|nr:uncharacterized protein LOC127248024 [Andrographis paniculata]
MRISLDLSDRTKMEKIEHKFVEVNGLKLHVAEIGSQASPAVVFLHGFPEIWYSWRYQMVAVAEAGFRAIGLDYRGFGLSDPPPVPEDAKFADLVSDVIALLDALSVPKAFLIGKDFGAWPAYQIPLLHPERVSGVVTLGVPYIPPPPPSAGSFLARLPEGFYVARWQKPGRAEADFGRLDNKSVIRNIYVLFSRAEMPTAAENQEIMDLVDSSTPLPSWFTEEDLAAYGSLYEKSGFRTALKVPYRSFSEELNVTNLNVDAPALFIIGEKDYFFKFPGMEDYVKNEGSKDFVPKLKTVYIPDGSHFVQEQFPEQVNKLIVDFLKENTNG